MGLKLNARNIIFLIVRTMFLTSRFFVLVLILFSIYKQFFVLVLFLFANENKFANMFSNNLRVVSSLIKILCHIMIYDIHVS